MTSDPGSGAPPPGIGPGGVGAGVGAGEAAPAAVSSSPPLTGDGHVDSVLERMRSELAELSEDDLTGRRRVLAGTDVELRALLDSDPGSDPESDPDPDPEPEPEPAASPGFPAR